MRLIDADAKALNPETINGIDFDTAIKEVETFLNSDECKYPLHIYLCAVRDFAEWYRDELKEAPTIDAAPVVRGEWIEAKSGVMSVWPEGQVMCNECPSSGRKCRRTVMGVAQRWMAKRRAYEKHFKAMPVLREFRSRNWKR